MAVWDKSFWKATAERCIGTFAASAIGVISVEAVENINQSDVIHAGWVVAVTTTVTFLKCIIANVTPGTPGPGFGDAEVLEEKK